MRSYLNRLKRHPGVPLAAIFTLLGALAGVREGGIYGAMGGAITMGVVFWAPVLITALVAKGE